MAFTLYARLPTLLADASPWFCAHTFLNNLCAYCSIGLKLIADM